MILAPGTGITLVTLFPNGTSIYRAIIPWHARTVELTSYVFVY
jgi:hypothetical protein